MATLPYRATVQTQLESELVEVQDWCRSTWPNTHGATWYRDWVSPVLRVEHGRPVNRYLCTWSFQFEEDLRMFQLAWYDFLESKDQQ
jgi:hypothetical protein